MRIRFLTSTPLDVVRGSGTFVGILVLGRALEGEGHLVEYTTPRQRLPVYTAQRLWFNRGLRPAREFDLTVGFDLDGYRIAAGNERHVASLKGVIADEVRFERGLTRLTMGIQAERERQHANRAARVLVTSAYSAARAREYYGLRDLPAVVPEPIELAAWLGLLEANPAPQERFGVLFVGRHYRRKRVDVLLRATAILLPRIPGLEVRIVGNGPCTGAWRKLAADLKLEGAVTWLGDVSRAQLAAEYNRASVFCLPSVQEGFGIVLLEAMAAGKPIVAARAAAMPEVAPHAEFFEPDHAEALAAAIQALYGSEAKREEMGRAGSLYVQRYDSPLVARAFLDAAAGARATCTST